jgi:hypothetical protein
MSVADAYLRMLSEAKKEEKLDPVDPKAVKKDFDDREDQDIDNDGDTDKSDEYLHNKRKAISKSVKKDEAVEIDPEDGEVTKKKDAKKSKKGEEEKVDMNEAKQGPNAEDQEKLEPKAKGEKDFKDDHEIEIKDRPDAVKQDNADKMKQAPARPGDNKQGDKLKTFKDIRK